MDLNSVITSGTAGASMEEAKGLYHMSILASMEEVGKATYVRKVMDEMTATLAHFNLSDQLIGFLGSSGPSQSTTSGSTSGFVVSGSFLSESSLRWPASRSISFSKSELAGDRFPFGTGYVEVGIFSGSVLWAPSGVEDVVASGAGSPTSSESFGGVACGAACGDFLGAASETDAGTASSFVDSGTTGAVPGTVSMFVDRISFGADGGASAAEPDAIPGTIHESFSSGPGVRDFSKLFDPTPASAAGIMPPVVV